MATAVTDDFDRESSANIPALVAFLVRLTILVGGFVAMIVHMPPLAVGCSTPSRSTAVDAYEHGLGRHYADDERDQHYLMTTVAPPATARTWRYWWPSGWWGDQGQTPHCVAYSWLHKVADGPRTTRRTPSVDTTPAQDPVALYCAAQRLDPWTGNCDDPQYDGTSVRAGAKALHHAGMIDGYRWAWDIDTVTRAVLEVGPVVVGTTWTVGMFTPDEHGQIRPEGSSGGGHAYIVNGVNLSRGLFRLKNSWGRRWGRDGHAWISIDDLADLLADRGEACLPTLR